MSKGQGIRDEWGKVGNNMYNISPIYQITSFFDHLIGSMQVTCTHRKDIDKLE